MPNRIRHRGYERYYLGVLSPNYPEPGLTGATADRHHDIFEEVCNDTDIDLVEAELMPDHVHLFVESPSRTVTSLIFNWVNGISSRWYNQHFSDRINCSRSYSVETGGSVSNGVVEQSIQEQTEHQT